MALKDTLAQLRQQEEQDAQWQQDKPRFIDEWYQAVAALLREIRGYLAEYEADGSMSFTERTVDLSEERLGRYRATAMNITAGPAIIVVAPVGRLIVGAMGRVDMYRQGRVGEADRIKILRVQTSPTDPTPQWAITPPPEPTTPRTMQPSSPARFGNAPRYVALTKDILEQAIEFLLGR